MEETTYLFPKFHWNFSLGLLFFALLLLNLPLLLFLKERIWFCWQQNLFCKSDPIDIEENSSMIEGSLLCKGMHILFAQALYMYR